MLCPRCHNEKHKKNGFVQRRQRYKCFVCSYNFSQSMRQGYPVSFKQKAVRYYLEGLTLRRIERLLCVSHVSVLNWAKKISLQIKKLKQASFCKKHQIHLSQRDELCSYLTVHEIEGESISELKKIPQKYHRLLLSLLEEADKNEK